MGVFVNEFAANPQVLPALVVFLLLSLPTFGYFYNKLMDRLNGRGEHMSLYVAIGCFVVLVFGSLISWRAALLYLFLFVLSGLPMIAGEFKRTEDRKTTSKTRSLRRKRLPYAANGCIEDAHDAAKEAQRLLGLAFKNNGKNPESSLPMAEASHHMNVVISKLVELKVIQNVDE
jgi:predicted membrane channel-forming protein YqfA (hemolysin III family)